MPSNNQVPCRRMKNITEIHGHLSIRQITSKCPQCGKISGSDLGSLPLDQYPDGTEVMFWCEEHGEWFQILKCELSLLQPYSDV